MYDIKIGIKNCNNISDGSITILKNHLNIKYGMNGTGKSTIANTLKEHIKGNNLESFKTFGSSLKPELDISEELNKVLVFDEEFIQSVIFNDKSVIDNSFDVFVKSPEYDKKLANINEKFKKIKVEIGQNVEVQEMLAVISEVKNKIQLSSNQKSVKNNPLVKSLIDKDSITNIPEELKKYEPFITNKKQNLDWMSWKNKGHDFDSICGCPFCTEELKENYQKEKEIFTASYKKSNIQNLIKTFEYFEALKDYINVEQYTCLVDTIRYSEDKETIQDILTKFISELNLIHKKITNSVYFDSTKLNTDNIKMLDKYLIEMKIIPTGFYFFNSNKSMDLYSDINKSLEDLTESLNDLRKNIGVLNSHIKLAVEKSIGDINEFLTQAGIKYEIEIKPESDSSSLALLKYKYGEDGIIVEGISKHLSWGEKNAFALILFVYYALSQDADLIILDDPVSSFDSNKKYAIINRIFMNDKKSKTFHQKNVILFTHDLEPIIDFLLNKKPHDKNVYPTYIRNVNGVLTETKIEKSDLKSIVKFFYEQSKNTSLNMVSRVIFLRKYIEHFVQNDKTVCVYDVLSSLVHGKKVPDKMIGFNDFEDIDPECLSIAILEINKFINNFDYDDIYNNFFSIGSLLKSYNDEEIDYIKIQIFRVYIEISNNRKNIQNDDNVLLKFIDEAFHIENDLVYTIDLSKFKTIPDHILSSCDDFMSIEINKNLGELG